ncbi:tRNA lysidine(34) synthetase TilS [Chondrinema litorale]|uniref:tRNA lysidine(34) synthetase TilS n=1 Tax=Chondrinema litorale TaxID=2994555 RepID=UPI002544AAE5|nr:tRNA lysidine(34) synthetase TilS [Chondrinema litorale]UZR94351.1 tRNA lysidine(34) synthetase TilS [Chondrinema litorale]
MFLQSFKEHITVNKLFKPTSKVLITISGGVDSVVMTKLFFDAGFKFELAHCNFQLRGKDSEKDAEFVRNIAERYNVGFHIVRFETEKFANENQLSTQMAARELRYSWFKEIRKNFDFDCIATAHHANDQLETMLSNLSRGTGLSGLKGMPTDKNGFIRPMIFASKKDILDYAKLHKIKWREDSSNVSEKYKRNLIRRKVVPVLEQINPALVNQLIFTTERLSEAEKIVENAYVEFEKNAIEKINDKESRILIASLQSTSSPLLMLDEYLKKYGFVYRQTRQIIDHLENKTGKIFYSNKYELLVDRAFLVLREKKEISSEITEINENDNKIKFSNINLSFNTIALTTGYKIPKISNIGCFDHSQLNFPLKIRNWKEGDWFVPIGMKGKKKISDFLTDVKLNLFEKQNVKVLCSGEDIVWIIGYRPDNRFKITEHTKIIYKIEIF